MGSDEMDVAPETGVVQFHSLSFHLSFQEWFACAAPNNRDLEHCMMTSSGPSKHLASAALLPPLIIELRSVVRVLLSKRVKRTSCGFGSTNPPAQTRDPQTVAFSSPPTSSSLSPCLTRASGRVAGCFASCFAVHFAFSTRLRL